MPARRLLVWVLLQLCVSLMAHTLTGSWTVPSTNPGPSFAVDALSARINNTHFLSLGGYFDSLSGSGGSVSNPGIWFCDTSDPFAPHWSFFKSSSILESKIPYNGAASIAYKPSTGDLIIAGGRTGGGSSMDIFSFNLISMTWTNQTVHGVHHMTNRYYAQASMIDNNRLILTGGYSDNDLKNAETTVSLSLC